MFTCPVCNNDYSDGVKCSKCLSTFCFSCANITESNYRKLGAVRQGAVLCSSCKGGAAHASLTVKPCVPVVSAATLETVLQELRNGIHGINVRLEQLPSIVQEIKNLKENLLNIDESLSSIKKDVQGNSSKIVEMEQRVQVLEEKPSLPDDYPLLLVELEKLNIELAAKDQMMRLNNIEIKGIPLKKNENLIEVVCRIGDVIGQPITKGDINFITRARSSAVPKPIIVGLLGRYQKENFVASARARKPGLTAEDLGYSGFSNKIYINDHLTKKNKQLLTKTKKAAAEHNHRYVWVQNCKILTRRNDTSPIIAISSEEDILKIK